MPKKQTWKVHALNFIKKYKKCPGDIPPTGDLTDLITEDTFKAMAYASGLHDWDSCHYTEEILGLPVTRTMNKLGLNDNQQELIESVKNLTVPIREVQQNKRLVELKARMTNYINRITFKKGELNIPSPLLRFQEYTEKFFS